MEHVLDMLEAVMAQADCRRRVVGAILVQQDTVVGEGWNGLENGFSCLGGECPRGLASYADVPARSDYSSGSGACAALHAEARAIQAAGLLADGGHMYVTYEPCPWCAELLASREITWQLVATPQAWSSAPTTAARP